MNQEGPRSGPSSRLPGRAPGVGGVTLAQAALRRRQAERAFEDYVREMARRWDLRAVPRNDGPGAGDVLPKV